MSWGCRINGACPQMWEFENWNLFKNCCTRNLLAMPQSRNYDEVPCQSVCLYLFQLIIFITLYILILFLTTYPCSELVMFTLPSTLTFNCFFFTFRYTSKPGVTYAIVLDWPKTDTLTLGVPIFTEATVVTLLGLPNVKFPWKQISEHKGVIITIPHLPVSDLPCQWAWVLRMTNVQ